MRDSIEIRVAKNGYIAMPLQTMGEYRPSTEIHVFENFDNLVEWMSRELKHPEFSTSAPNSESKEVSE